jgi:16S rRNA processing protein RimM
MPKDFSKIYYKMTHDDCFELGSIQKTHGIKGEVVIYLDVDDPIEYEDMESVFVEIKGQLVPYFIENLRFQRDTVIVKFEEIDTIDKAQVLTGCKLFMTLDNLPELEEGQFYYHDIIGYTVRDAKAGLLGEIIDFYELPQHDILAMLYQSREILIPVSDEIITSVNHKKKELETLLPEGLLELYLNENQGQDDGFGEVE